MRMTSLFIGVLILGCSRLVAAPTAEDAGNCTETLVNKNYSQKVSANLLARKITDECFGPHAPTKSQIAFAPHLANEYAKIKSQFVTLVQDAIVEKRAQNGIKLIR